MGGQGNDGAGRTRHGRVGGLTGDVSALVDLPTTKKGWLYLLLVVIGVVALIFAVHHYWPWPSGVRPAG